MKDRGFRVGGASTVSSRCRRASLRGRLRVASDPVGNAAQECAEAAYLRGIALRVGGFRRFTHLGHGGDTVDRPRDLASRFRLAIVQRRAEVPPALRFRGSISRRTDSTPKWTPALCQVALTFSITLAISASLILQLASSKSGDDMTCTRKGTTPNSSSVKTWAVATEVTEVTESQRQNSRIRRETYMTGLHRSPKKPAGALAPAARRTAALVSRIPSHSQAQLGWAVWSGGHQGSS